MGITPKEKPAWLLQLVPGGGSASARRCVLCKDFDNLSDEKKEILRKEFPGMIPSSRKDTYKNTNDNKDYMARRLWKRDNPDATEYPKQRHDLHLGLDFYDFNFPKGETAIRKYSIHSLCMLKLLLHHGCGKQGHLKCYHWGCNLVLSQFLERCPEDAGMIHDYLMEESANGVLSQWYSIDHFLAVAKTLRFGGFYSGARHMFFKLVLEHRNSASCVSCGMEHNRKGRECQDNLSVSELEKNYPKEFQRQVSEYEKNKAVPISKDTFPMSVFCRPLREFEAVEGTNLAKYVEPSWFDDFLELFFWHLQEGHLKEEEHAELPAFLKKKAAAKKTGESKMPASYKKHDAVAKANAEETAKELLGQQDGSDDDTDDEIIVKKSKSNDKKRRITIMETDDEDTD